MLIPNFSRLIFEFARLIFKLSRLIKLSMFPRFEGEAKRALKSCIYIYIYMYI